MYNIQAARPNSLPPNDDSLDGTRASLIGNLEFREPGELKQLEKKTVRESAATILHSKSFHVSIVILCCLDGLLVLVMLLLEIEVLKLKAGHMQNILLLVQMILECVSLAIVSLFLIEVPLKIWVFGIRFYGRHWLEILDAVVCIISFSVDVYNVVRHEIHISHPTRVITANESTHIEPNQLAEAHSTVQGTIADAAGFLVLFRLWRVLRIVNAIIVSITTSQEGVMENLRRTTAKAQKRVEQLEQILRENDIPIPSQSS
ncbi:unnamed protein product [Calicophoron daubneyi]|uniref:Voltage-gated hydrogen channel 1 n=1 Tax=Calicophoron daubneyi TaxID=300641 RepID=A0AAV2TVC4_CALDB